jgi:hypothetical protein
MCFWIRRCCRFSVREGLFFVVDLLIRMKLVWYVRKAWDRRCGKRCAFFFAISLSPYPPLTYNPLSQDDVLAKPPSLDGFLDSMSRCSTGCAALAVHTSPAHRVPLSLLSAALALAIIYHSHRHHHLKPQATANVPCPPRLIFSPSDFDSVQRLFSPLVAWVRRSNCKFSVKP